MASNLGSCKSLISGENKREHQARFQLWTLKFQFLVR
uniref:Uncharacterized protein n=1 Tax=Arundo donax TaxID=35708 RepID=A0A0A9H888_ARUDO